MSVPADELVGTNIAGRYAVRSVLGHGGLSTVYRAFDSRLSRAVALKVLSPGLLRDEAAERGFQSQTALTVTHLLRSMDRERRETPAWYAKKAGADFSVIHDQASFYRQHASHPIMAQLFPRVLDAIGKDRVRCYSMPWYEARSSDSTPIPANQSRAYRRAGRRPH